MNTKNLVIALAAVAAANKEGYTVNAATLQPVSSGYAVALAATQNSFGEAGLNKVVNYVMDLQNDGKNAGDLAFGGWFNTDNNQYYYDATVVLQDRAKAIELGRANKQIAIFDLNNMEEIRL